MAENSLRVRIRLDVLDKALGALKNISQGSKETAATLKAAREQLKQLNETQKTVGKFTEARKGLGDTEAKLQAANEKVRQLATTMGSAGPPTKAMAQQFAAARTEASKLGAQFTAERQRVQQLRDKLSEAGISTKNLASHDQQLRASIATTTANIQRQTEALKRQGDEQRKLARIQQQSAKAAAIGGGMAAAGAVGVYASRQAMKPVQATAGAYAKQEDASTQLQASMMAADGSVSAEFAKIDALAKRLGDRLPGTTADFIEMMTMLKRQGLSDQVILGGTGEAAALLGVQLKMPITAAAEFAAKMQDATRTTEKDMLGLMDTIQRSYYLGVDSGNMLQGFTKISPVLSIMRKEGLEASKMLAPLLVMMDQAGMDGGSAGNAYRKIFQAGMNTEKIKKVTDGLKVSKKLSLDLNFTDGKGEFGGIEKMYAQLEKLKNLNTETRLSVMKDLFGDDSETLTVLNTMISKGQAGYDEVVAKMEAQAGLQSRVNQQLGTLSNVVEAAQGSATNTMAAIGATMAPDLKNLVDWLGEASGKAGKWVQENEGLVRILSLGVMGFSAFLAAVSVLLIPLGLLLAKGFLVRLMMAKLAGVAAGSGAFGGMAAGAGRLVPLLARLALGFLRMLGPIGLLMTAGLMVYSNWTDIVGGAKLLWEDLSNWLGSIWTNMVNTGAMLWQGFTGVLGGVWSMLLSLFMGTLQQIATISDSVWQGIIATATGLWSGFMATLSSIWAMIQTAAGMAWQGMATMFSSFGGWIIDGLIGGITSKLGQLRDTVVGAATSAAQWFKEKLGINSPSRVFTQYGGWISEGAALGIEGGQSAVRAAALAMAASAMVPVGAGAADAGPGFAPSSMIAASGSALSPRSVMASAPATGGNTYAITINPPPGMDPQAIARAVAAELDRRELAKGSRKRSSLSDLD